MDRSRIFAHVKENLQGDGPTDLVLSGGNALIDRKFVGRLIEVLVHDAGDHFEILQQRHLADLGLTEDEAFALGERNLEGLVDAGTVMAYAHGDGFAIVAGGNHEASLMLVPSLCTKLAEHVGTPFLLAAAPARDLLMVASAESAAGAAELHRLLDRVRYVEVDHALPGDLYRWDGLRWHLVGAAAIGQG